MRGEQKVSFCSDGLVEEPGRKAEAVDSGGVDDRSDNGSKEKGEEGEVTDVETLEPVRVGKEERDNGVDDDRVIFDDGYW